METITPEFIEKLGKELEELKTRMRTPEFFKLDLEGRLVAITKELERLGFTYSIIKEPIIEGRPEEGCYYNVYANLGHDCYVTFDFTNTSSSFPGKEELTDFGVLSYVSFAAKHIRYYAQIKGCEVIKEE